jgi:hypothetical protein
MADRTVHGRARNGSEIVRYDKAGHWFLEGAYVLRGERVRITLGEAVFLVTRDGAEVFFGLPGGRAFDYKVKAELLR